MLLLRFLKQLLEGFGQDKIGQLSAAFAYIAVFSIGPLLLVMVSVAGFIYGEQAVAGSLFSQLSELVGPETAATLQNAMAQTYESGNNIFALMFGIVGILLAASSISGQLQNSFDSILCAVPDPKAGIKRSLFIKIKNIFLVLLGGITVAASIIVSTIIIGLGSTLQQKMNLPPITLEIVNNLLSLVIFTAIIYLIYKAIPGVQIPRKIILTTALVVAVLFLLGKVVLGIIIGNNATVSAYGAAASLVMLLLWIYYSGQLLFIGAEGMKVYGINKDIAYTAKRFNLKRTSLHIDAKGFKARLAESFVRGFRNKRK